MDIQYFWHDVILGLLFIFGVIGLRFNQWPIKEQPLYSGPPREYTHFSRFSAFYLIYSSSMTIVVFFLSSMGSILFQFLETYAGDFYSTVPLLHGIRLQFGDSSILASAIIVYLIIKIPTAETYEIRWRTFLQRAARIPQAVYEKIATLKANPRSFTPKDRDIIPILDYLRENNIHLKQVSPEDFIEGAGEEKSVEHLYVKIAYLLQRIQTEAPDKPKGLANYLQNLDDKKRRLNEIGLALSVGNLDVVTEKTYGDELNRLQDIIYECIARMTVIQCASEESQRRTFLRYNLKLPYKDTRPKLEGILWLMLAGIVGLSMLLTISYEVVINLFSMTELERVSPGSFMAILSWVKSTAILFFSAILTGIMTEKMFEEDQYEISVRSYVWSFMVSYLIAFIYLVSLRGELLPQFYLYSLSPATASTLVVWNLLNTQYFILGNGRWQAPLRTATHQAAILGTVTLLICLGRSVLFPASNFTFAEAVGFTFFGGLIGASMGFIIGFVFAHEIRAQLVCRNRRSPRARFIEQVQAEVGPRNVYAATENISLSGLMLTLNDNVEVGQHITLRLSFASVVGRVVWRAGSRLGIRFEHTDQSLKPIEGFIRRQFGPQMLYR
ncbi:PilZ domain-containing protein [Hahella ganghwensis]|uniref:PilZ domain-containing protein n=1 Tax=Hahella ganghwensis TaxID=286420 RepID=UPI0003A8C7D1|nr:PilZ domain-containing protein [Hahella ganghwensis]